MKNLCRIAIVIISCATALSANAQNRIGLRDESRRIHQGVASGQLTPTETRQLQAQKAQLKVEAIRFKLNDGRISRRERAILKKDNRELDKNIMVQKHDVQTRF